MSVAILKARIAELEARVAALTPKPTGIVAGEVISKGAMLIVDVGTLEAFESIHVKTVPGKRKIFGTAKHDTQKGEPVSIKHWFCEEPCEPDCFLCAQVNL